MADDFKLSDIEPQPAVIADLTIALVEAGLNTAFRLTHVEVFGRDCIVEIQQRPRYCDRGRWLVHARPKPGHEIELNLDAHDGFPRYYFGNDALVSEVVAWMRARHQLG